MKSAAKNWRLAALLVAHAYQVLDASAQLRNANWLNNWNWISFGQGTPQSIAWTPPLGGTSACISDTLGVLQAYIGAYGIRGSDHELITNHPAYPAYLVGANLQQSPIFIPKPGDPGHALLIYCHELPAGAGRRLGHIELDLVGQAVVDTGFTWFMEDPTVKRLTVPHANGTDYWFVAHESGTNTYNAFQITANGLLATPVVSQAGASNPAGFKHGMLVPTVGGDRFIAVHSGNYDYDVPTEALMDLMAFDQQTGQIALVHSFSGLRSVEGAEFSANGRFLYVLEFHNVPGQTAPCYRDLYQYDLDAADIGASRVLVDAESSSSGFTPTINKLAMAIDGRIYRGTLSADTVMAMVPEPNLAAPACGYVPEAFQPNGPFVGLPAPMKRYHDDAGLPLSAPPGLPGEPMSIFPNPAYEWVRLHGAPPSATQAVVRDAMGRMVLARGLANGVLDIGALASGSYAVEVLDANGMRLGAVRVMKE